MEGPNQRKRKHRKYKNKNKTKKESSNGNDMIHTTATITRLRITHTTTTMTTTAVYYTMRQTTPVYVNVCIYPAGFPFFFSLLFDLSPFQTLSRRQLHAQVLGRVFEMLVHERGHEIVSVVVPASEPQIDHLRGLGAVP